MVALLGALAWMAAPAEVLVTVDAADEVGPIKIMNAVNNGPSKARADQSRGNFADYKALRIPYARTHDSINQATSNGHTVDISAVFPNFDADENDPKNYDFAYTDKFLETIIAAGTKPFFRLGQTIENGIKKYHVYPPKDYAKWARICEHVILHCNEGWCDGHKWGIEYWEIWNEPDAQLDEDRSKSCQWQGTKAQFFEFFKVAAQHLKKRFPHLKIGGPAHGFRMDWADEFLAYQQAAGTQLDFFSWHNYHRRPNAVYKRRAPRYRELLDKYGYKKTEIILNEWNYVKDWSANFPYSASAISEAKGGAYTAAFMSFGQNSPVDMLMYYDARPGTIFNGLFDLYTYMPRPAYYALFSWADLRELGTQVKATVEFPDRQAVIAKAEEEAKWASPPPLYESMGIITNEIVTAVAATGADHSLGVLITRFTDDNNITSAETVTLKLASGRFAGRVRGYVTDGTRMHSPVHLFVEPDGSVSFSLLPNSFIYIEASLKPMDVVLTFDDGVKDHLLVAAPELEKRGWRGIFCIVPEWIGKNERKLTWDDVRELKRRGHEIASHTLSHVSLAKLAGEGKLDQLRHEIAAARDIIAKETGEAPKVLCIPFGSITPAVYRIAAEEGQIVLPVDRTNFGKGTKVGTKYGVKARIRQYMARGTGYCDVLSHGIREAGGGWNPFATTEDFQKHLDDIASFGDSIRVVTGDAAHEAMRRHASLQSAR